MVQLILNFCFYLFTALFLYRKEKGLTINVLCFLYLSFFAFTGVLIYDTEYYMWGNFNIFGSRVRNQMSIFPLLFLYVGFLIYFLIIKDVNSGRIKGFFQLKPWAENTIYYVNIIILILIILAYKDSAFQLSDFADAYESDGVAKEKQSAIGYLGLAALIISTGLQFSQQILIFYMFAKNNALDIIKGIILLLLYLVSSYLEGAISGSRGKLFFSIAYVFFSFSIFKSFLPRKINKYIFTTGLVLLFIFISLVIVISIDRFGDTYLLTIASYFGEPFINFPLIFWNFPNFFEGDYFLSRIGFSTITNHTKIDLYYFKTLPGAIYLDFGVLGTFFFLSIYAFMFKKLLGTPKYYISMDKLLVYFYVISGFVFGAFSFSVLGWSGYVILIMNYFLFKYSKSDKLIQLKR